jgi:hypothetical protein
VAGFKINADVIAGYAKKVDTTADGLNGATDSGSVLTVESFGVLGAQVGLGESYAHASEALRRQLFGGCAALRSASEAFTQGHGAPRRGDDESAELIKRAGEL